MPAVRGAREFGCSSAPLAALRISLGAVAAQTTLPVIGVPLARTPLQGQDALLATVQMPSGIPVATVAVNGAANAALLAVQILGVADAAIESRVSNRREANRSKVIADDEAMMAGKQS